MIDIFSAKLNDLFKVKTADEAQQHITTDFNNNQLLYSNQKNFNENFKKGELNEINSYENQDNSHSKKYTLSEVAEFSQALQSQNNRFSKTVDIEFENNY